MDLMNRTMQMDGGFEMHIHHHSTQFGRLLDITLRLLNHVVHIERFLTSLGHSLKHRESKRNVRNERAVHHIEVKPVGLTPINHVDVAVEMQEVGSEQ